MAWTWKIDLNKGVQETNTIQFSEDRTSILRISDGKIIIRNAITGKLENELVIDYPNIEKEKAWLIWNKANKQMAMTLSGPTVLLFDLDR